MNTFQSFLLFLAAIRLVILAPTAIDVKTLQYLRNLQTLKPIVCEITAPLPPSLPFRFWLGRFFMSKRNDWS